MLKALRSIERLTAPDGQGEVSLESASAISIRPAANLQQAPPGVLYPPPLKYSLGWSNGRKNSLGGPRESSVNVVCENQTAGTSNQNLANNAAIESAIVDVELPLQELGLSDDSRFAPSLEPSAAEEPPFQSNEVIDWWTPEGSLQALGDAIDAIDREIAPLPSTPLHSVSAPPGVYQAREETSTLSNLAPPLAALSLAFDSSQRVECQAIARRLLESWAEHDLPILAFSTFDIRVDGAFSLPTLAVELAAISGGGVLLIDATADARHSTLIRETTTRNVWHWLEARPNAEGVRGLKASRGIRFALIDAGEISEALASQRVVGCDGIYLVGPPTASGAEKAKSLLGAISRANLYAAGLLLVSPRECG